MRIRIQRRARGQVIWCWNTTSQPQINIINIITAISILRDVVVPLLSESHVAFGYMTIHSIHIHGRQQGEILGVAREP
jgi:hypothetical protein